MCRYIAAIKRIQPTGPYVLLGFSFGATLAYEAAKQLLAQGETVSELYLIDGFPAHLFQSLSNKTHADLLQTLFGFIVTILNNSYYAEKLKPIKLSGFATTEKLKQIETCFNYFETKVVNPASKRLLSVAKQHLLLLLRSKEPQHKLPLWPTLYLTTKEQPYHQVINELPDLSKKSADYQYLFWNLYFDNITRCGLELEGDHLSIGQDGPPIYKRTPDCFFQRAHDPVFNLKVDHYGPKTIYRLDPSDSSHSKLSIFFLNPKFIPYYVKQLTAIGLSPQIAYYDKNIPKYERSDTTYTAQATLFCCVPNDQIEQLKSCFPKISFISGSSERTLSTDDTDQSIMKQSGSIDLIVFWGRTELLTLSFKYHSLPERIISSLQQQLGLIPLATSADKHNITYKHSLIMTTGGTYDAIDNVTNFLADFIAVLQSFIIQEPAQLSALPPI